MANLAHSCMDSRIQPSYYSEGSDGDYCIACILFNKAVTELRSASQFTHLNTTRAEQTFRKHSGQVNHRSSEDQADSYLHSEAYNILRQVNSLA